MKAQPQEKRHRRYDPSMEPGEKHRKRFRRWQGRVGEKTQILAGLVESRLVPLFTAAGFQWVDVVLGQADWTVNPGEICLERLQEAAVDSIDISFGKYGDAAPNGKRGRSC